MKKIKVLMLLTAMALVAGCGKKETAEDKRSTESVAVVDAGEETLMVPEVSMGETKPGEDAVEVVFTWDAVKGADGYEVYEENKFYDEDEYREAEGVTSTTEDTTYTTGAQDYFDFRIKVRAYKGDGDSREYSDWSEFAYGCSYEAEDVASDVVNSGSATQEEADQLFEEAINGDLVVQARYEDGSINNYYITDLPNDPDDYYSYEVGERIDLDNDGVTELVINGPDGGIYLDARTDGVYQLAQGEGTTGVLCYTDYEGKRYICHVDNSHGGREYFMMDQYDGSGQIVESLSLTAEYWDSVEFDADIAQCRFNDQEISVDEYLKLRKELFGY